MRFEIGDIVSRDGTDEHEVIGEDDGLTMRVRCIKPSREGWCEVGDEEINLSRRYELVRHAI